MLLPPATTTRRTAMGGALAVVALTACDLQELDPRGDLTSGPSASAPPVDADTTLVKDVLADLGPTLLLVAATRRRHAPLRAPLAPLVDLHEAHLVVLGQSEGSAPTSRPPADARTALDLVRRREQSLQRRLVAAAVAAESGQLAKLLASMSAGVAQHLAALEILDLEAPQ